MKSFASALALAAALTAPADAFWRMECHSRTGLGRIDPIVNPGVPAPHMHTIHGGKNVKFDTTFEDLRASECTSCLVKQDTSLYWTPTMHFVYANGTSVMVPQTGGMLAYYFLIGEDIKAFEPGFRMVAGDKLLRNFTGPTPDKPKTFWDAEDKTQFSLGQKAIGFNCLNYGGIAEPTTMRHEMPSKKFIDENCKNGIRAELYFPSCSDGRLDSDNHRDHMAYPDQLLEGSCPDSHPTRNPALLYETIWDTYNFDGVDGEFVFSQGDPTGCGYHGDFVTGWEQDLLQNAIETCTGLSGKITDCPLFDIQTEADGAMCKFDVPEELKDEDCEKPHEGLFNGQEIQYGPGYAQDADGGKAAPATPKVASIPAAPAPPKEEEPAPEPEPVPEPEAPVPQEAEVEVDAAAAAPEPEPMRAPEPEPEPVPAPPATTPAPVYPAELPEGERVLSTSTYTKDGVVYVVEYVETDVTVTATETAYYKHKRHEHVHAHAHKHRRGF